MDELRAKHKKELKGLEGEKRTALKKIKGTAGKGKKGKEALAKAEEEWDRKILEVQSRHADEVSDVYSTTDTPSTPSIEPPPDAASDEVAARNAKREKARQEIRDAYRALQSQVKSETDAAGPSERQVELDRLHELYLDPNGLAVVEVQADGHCLYRAVAQQLALRPPQGLVGGHMEVRKVCAIALMEGREEFEAFADLGEGEGAVTFEEYVERVKDSSEWGGHLELRALAVGLKRTIVVYSADGAPLRIEGGDTGGEEEKDDIRLSFHKSYYALGEHYNSVIKVKSE